MKTKCLDDFYNAIETDISKEFSLEIKNLIEKEELTSDKLTEIIEKGALNEWF